MPLWSEADLQYAAGYLDGEGCFTLGPHWKPTVTCANTHRPTIEWLHYTFGGNLTLNISGRKANHRPTHRWALVSKQAAEFCRAITPYLREKVTQAGLLIAVHQTMGIREGRYTPIHIVEERNRLATILKGYKHVVS